MTTVFHASPYSRFVKIQSNLRRKKLHRRNKGTNFLGCSFSNRDNVRAPIPFSNLEDKVNPSILKDDFSSWTDRSILSSIEQVLSGLPKLNINFARVNIDSFDIKQRMAWNIYFIIYLQHQTKSKSVNVNKAR